MSWTRFLVRAARDRRRAEEIDAHIRLHADDLAARGVPIDEAIRRARVVFGNPRGIQEELDAMNRLPIFDVLWRDVKYALRVLRRTPAFTLTALATLALVIGANTAVLSLADELLMRPLPYPHPERLAVADVWQRGPRGADHGDSVDGTMWEAIRDRVPAVDAALYSGGFGRGVNLVIDSTATFVRQQRVSAGYFHVLGVPLLMGRELTRDEDRPGGPALAILSYGLWQRGFHGASDILGRKILLRGEPYEVIGVTPKRFVNLTGDADVWTPLRPSRTGEGGGTNYGCIMRLKDQAAWTQATAEMGTFGRDTFDSLGAGDTTSVWMTVRSFHDDITEGDREPLVLLVMAAGVVLLIACVNLAALLLARGSARAKEIATRMALGSGRAAVVRQLMVESVLLALAGGVLGAFVGMAGLDALKSLGGDTFQDWTLASIDGRILAMTAGIALLTSLVFGLVPAWQASRVDVQQAMTDAGSRSIAGGASHWGRRLLVAAEVALGVVLLVCAGLLVRTFVSLRAINPGFDGRGVITASVSLQDARYQTAVATNRLIDRSLQQIESTPGVLAAGVSLGLPYERILNSGVRFVDESAGHTVNVSYVTPDYFTALSIPVLSGRVFEASDTAASPQVAIVNATFVEMYSKDRPVLGRQFLPAKDGRVIVGVVGDVRQKPSGARTLDDGPLVRVPIMYVAAAQMTDAALQMVHTWFRPVWVVRAADPATAAGVLRSAIQSVDPLLPVSDVQTMNQVELTAMSEQRLLMSLVGALALAALLLSAIGLHGLIAQSVIERTREFGITLALGATSVQTMRSAAMPGMVMAAIGAAFGLALSVPATQLVGSFLWGVRASDPATYLGAAAFLLVVAVVSSALPSLRLMRLDPAKTLRN